jgi:hypothetical protein
MQISTSSGKQTANSTSAAPRRAGDDRRRKQNRLMGQIPTMQDCGPGHWATAIHEIGPSLDR